MTLNTYVLRIYMRRRYELHSLHNSKLPVEHARERIRRRELDQGLEAVQIRGLLRLTKHSIILQNRGLFGARPPIPDVPRCQFP
jgi:hypothetical protein